MAYTEGMAYTDIDNLIESMESILAKIITCMSQGRPKRQ